MHFFWKCSINNDCVLYFIHLDLKLNLHKSGHPLLQHKPTANKHDTDYAYVVYVACACINSTNLDQDMRELSLHFDALRVIYELWIRMTPADPLIKCCPMLGHGRIRWPNICKALNENVGFQLQILTVRYRSQRPPWHWMDGEETFCFFKT